MTQTMAEKAFAVAKTRIESCQRDGRTSLSLAGLKSLQQLPKEILALNVDSIDISKTSISEISILASMPQLASLNLSETRVSNILPLRLLPGLVNLNLYRTTVQDISPLAGKQLKDLTLWDTPVADLSILASLSKLRSLDLDDVKLDIDFGLFKNMHDLACLYVSRTSISTLSGLKHIRLRALHFSETDISDLSPIAHMSDLRILIARNTQIKSLEPLRGMKNLHLLRVGSTPITDISPIADFTQLSTLDISNTDVSDLTPVRNLDSLLQGAQQTTGEDYGIDFRLCPIEGDELREISNLQNPARTIRLFEYLRGNSEPEKEGFLDPELVEPQRPTSIVFSVDESGRVDVDATAGQDIVRNDELHQQLHDELLSQLGSFLRRCEPGQPSSNQLAPWRDLGQRFSDALGGGPDEMAPALAVLRGNLLRLAVELDDNRRLSPDPDDAPMPEAASSELRGVVQSWNVYVSTDPFLDNMDSARLGPDDRLSEPSVEATSKAIKAAENLNFATPEAIEALQDTQRALSRTARSNERSSAFRLEGLRNFAREVVRVAIVVSRASAKGVHQAVVGTKKLFSSMVEKYSEEVAKQLGKRTVDALYWSGLAWISTQLPWLTALFGPGSAMRQILEQIAKSLQ